MHKVVLLLGGNLGDVERTLEGVCSQIERELGKIESRSSLVKSPAWGFESAEFTNRAVLLHTELAAEELLDSVQRLEEQWGRDRAREHEAKAQTGERYMARTIDIDIIFYGDRVISTPRLTTPHSLMAEREFVLKPLAQIAPHWIHPISGKSVEEMLNELKKE